MKYTAAIKQRFPYLLAPLFWAFLIVKLVCGWFFASHYLQDLFIPFIDFFVDSGLRNPWNEFLARGIVDAFPYSGTMLAVLSFPIELGRLFYHSASAIPLHVQFLLVRLPMLLADVLIYAVLCQWFRMKWRSVLVLYWASPILFYITYIHGQIDVIPTAFLFLSLWFTVRDQPIPAGLLLGAGIGAKFHLAASIPLLGFYFFKKNRGPQRIQSAVSFLGAIGIALAVIIGPTVTSAGYRLLVLQAKESRWVFALGLTMPQDIRILFCPTIVLILIMHFFSYQKVSKDVLVLYAGLLYSALIVFVFPMPGWSFWSIPFLCYFLIRQNVATYVPFWAYNVFYLIYFGIYAPGVGWMGQNPDLAHSPAWLLHRDLAFTFMQSSLALSVLWVYRVGVRGYVRYKVRDKSLAIGIGGDSASGKHTLADVLEDLLGKDHTIRLHGDDYHRWPRHHESWKVQTHLDPRSNYFQQPIEHIQSLKSGTPVSVASYDHVSGIFAPPHEIGPNRYILFEGLHPFVFQRMREAFDLRIFLATEENLRARWKTSRDTKERGHSEEEIRQELERRKSDAERYVSPQAQFADWVIEYFESERLDEKGESLAARKLKVKHQVSSNVMGIERIMDELSMLKGQGLSVAWTMADDLRRQIFEIEGSLSHDHIEAIAIKVFPDLNDWIAQRPVWHDGFSGINQLIFLALLDRAVAP